MKKDSSLDILLLLRLSYGSGRDILHGLSTWVRRERCPWRLHAVNFEVGRVTSDIHQLFESSVDGVVAHGWPHSADPEVSAFGGPVVFIGEELSSGLRNRAGPTMVVRADEAEIGRRGAAYLESLGRMRSYGFVMRTSSMRANAFQAHLMRRHDDVRMFKGEPLDKTGGFSQDIRNRDALAAWLRALPKPAAVMADTDNLALFVLEAAEIARVKIPKDVALLGVDNDEILCESSDPPLASIAVDHEKLGALAAEALRRMLEPTRGRRAADARAATSDLRLHHILLPSSVRGVVERQSARPVAPAAALAERAAAFIRHNALKGINAADVAAHLGVSRALADLRFRQIFGESLLGMILRLRLDAAKRKLRETNLPIGQIVASCGFGSQSRAKHLFRERMGCSMREWRRKHRETPDE